MRLSNTLVALLLFMPPVMGRAAAAESSSTPVASVPEAKGKRYGIVPFRPGVPQSLGPITSITPTCSSPHLSYFNGPVVSNVQVVPILWGPNVNLQTTTHIAQFYADATVSNWYDLLSEYASIGGTNQSIGRGTSIPAITITPSRCGSTVNCTVTDAQLQTEIANQITAAHLPAPQLDSTGNTTTAYMMHFPPNVTLTGPDGAGNSCVQFCAYHNTFIFGANNTAMPYGAIMDTYTSACSSGCGGNATALQNETSVASHELSEIITDADIGLDTGVNYAFPAAWGDNFNQCGEIADICDSNAPGSTITVGANSWIVQQLWSNAKNACVGTGLFPNYVISAPSTIQAGTPFIVTVTAKNPAGNKGTDTAYVGKVHFTSNDPSAVLPADFTYVIADQGAASFTVTLNSLGSRTITATDTLNGNIVGTSSAIEVLPDTAAASHCSGADSFGVAFSDDFPGTSLDPGRWLPNANGGTITVVNNSVALSGSPFPYVTAVGSPIPSTGNFSVRWIATYGAQQSAGTSSLAVTQTLPANGASSWLDVADAWQDGTGYRLRVQNPAGTQSPAWSDPNNPTPAMTQHDVEYCWLSSTMEVYVDGAQKLQQARDPALQRPTTLWFGNPSNSAAAWQPFTLYFVEVRALEDNSTVAVMSSLNPSAAGQQVTLTATVTAASAVAGTPTGSVAFTNGANAIGSGTLDGSGVASVTTSALGAGSHSITATYGGDVNFNGSTGSTSQFVLANSATNLSTACSRTVVENQSVALTATITGANPSGSVSFQDGATVMCGSVTMSSGNASCQTPALTVQGGGTSSTDSMTASYAGDAANEPSSSSALILTVIKASDFVFRSGFQGSQPGCAAN